MNVTSVSEHSGVGLCDGFTAFAIKALSMASVVAPHFLCGFNHQAQFVALVFDGDVVAVHGAGKATLR